MADEDLTDITPVTSLTDDARFYAVNDVGGTPADVTVEKDEMAGVLGVSPALGGVQFHKDLCAVTGELIPARTIVSQSGGGAAETLGNGQSYTAFYPFWLPFDMDVDAFATDIYTTAASSSRKYAIFDGNNPTTPGFPGSLIDANATAEISTASSGMITVALAADISLTAGTLYWVGYCADTNDSDARSNRSGDYIDPVFPSRLSAPTSHLDWAASVIYKTGDRHSGFPANAEDLDFTTGTTEATIAMGTLFLRGA